LVFNIFVLLQFSVFLVSRVTGGSRQSCALT
jgi:hypothetical protein